MAERLVADLALVEAVLAGSAEDHAALVHWERRLGIPRGGWRHVPPLRELACMAAVAQLAAAMPEISRAAAIEEAAEAIGLGDRDPHGPRPSDALARRLRRWVSDAARAADTDVPDMAVRALGSGNRYRRKSA